MTIPCSQKRAAGEQVDDDQWEDASDSGESTPCATVPTPVSPTHTQNVPNERGAAQRGYNHDDSPPASLLVEAPAMANPDSNRRQEYPYTPRPLHPCLLRRGFPVATRPVQPQAHAATLRGPRVAGGQPPAPYTLPVRPSLQGPPSTAASPPVRRGESVGSLQATPAKTSSSSPSTDSTSTQAKTWNGTLVGLFGGNRKASTRSLRTASPIQPTAGTRSASADARGPPTRATPRPWGPAPTNPMLIKNPRTREQRRLEHPADQFDYNQTPEALRVVPVTPEKSSLPHPLPKYTWTKPLSPRTKKRHEQAARAQKARALHLRNQRARRFSFSKRPVGPLQNPNPLFYDGMSDGLTEGNSGYWEFLAENFWLDDEGNGMTPHARNEYLRKPEVEVERTAAEDNHESHHGRRNPGSDDKDNLEQQGSLGVDGSNDEHPRHPVPKPAEEPRRSATKPVEKTRRSATKPVEKTRRSATKPAKKTHRAPTESTQKIHCRGCSPPFGSLLTPAIPKDQGRRKNIAEYDTEEAKNFVAHLSSTGREISADLPPQDLEVPHGLPAQGREVPGHLPLRDTGAPVVPSRRDRDTSHSLPQIFHSSPQPYPDEGYPVIVQAGQNDNLMKPDRRKPKPYERPYMKMPDPIAQLAADEAIEAWENDIRHEGILILSEAQLPVIPLQAPIRMSTLSALMFWEKNKASAKPFKAPKLSPIDRQQIRLTPRLEIPRYAFRDSSKYWNMQVKFPYLAFGRDGLLMQSTLTHKMIELFLDPRHTPEWAHTIPDYYSVRAAERDRGFYDRQLEPVDLDIDPWVFYWKTLVVKADIRCGAQLASKAASIIYHEKMTYVENLTGRV